MESVYIGYTLRIWYYTICPYRGKCAYHVEYGIYFRFGEDTMEKVVSWIDDCEEIHSDDSIIDLGCGNGMMCIELVRYY